MPRTSRLSKLAILTAAVASSSCLAVQPAHASLLGGVLPGILSPKTAPAACPVPQQSFAAFGDTSWYQLAPGGAFEGQPGWKLSGPAAIVADNEPWHIAGADDSHALQLAPGASALSPAACFGAGDVKMRLFLKGSGSVHVGVVVSDVLGVLSVLDGGTVRAGGSWQPSPQISLAVTSLGGLVSTDAIQLRLTAVDGNVEVDDVAIDPWKFV